MKFKEGDCVRIIVRDTTPADTKRGTYYPHFGGLSGTIDRIYDDEVCIKVDQESLPEGVLKRHMDIQESIRRKWLNGLSGEARNKLTSEEKQFRLSYMMLVQSTDLEQIKPGAPRPAEVRKLEPLNPPADSAKPAKPPKAEAPEAATREKAKVSGKSVSTPAAESEPKTSKGDESKPAAPKSRSTSEPAKPVSSDDLEAAELAFLREREKALKKKG